MYKKILVPLALNHGISEQTLAVAHALCAKGGEITALHVFELPQGTVSEIYIFHRPSFDIYLHKDS